MRKVDDKALALARVYADSMLTLAKAERQEESLLEELRDLGNYLEENEGFARFLLSPMVDDDPRRESIEKIFRGNASDVLVNALQVMNDKNRLEILPAVVEAYRLAFEDDKGQIDVHVKSAVALTDDQRTRLKEVIKDRIELEAVLFEEVDDNLIGGMVVFVGDQKLDVTVSRQLRQLHHSFRERATQEIHDRHDSYFVESGA